MEITGTVIKSLPAREGTSQKGAWIKRYMVIQTPGPYGKEVMIEFFGNKGDDLKSLKKGQEVTVHFDLESREYQGKYFTEVKGYKIVPGAVPNGQRPAQQQQAAPREQYVEAEPGYQDDSELPF